jgi:hypothetical protein
MSQVSTREKKLDEPLTCCWEAPKCLIADEALYLHRLREDLLVEIQRLKGRAKHYGEIESELRNSVPPSDLISFAQILKSRERDLRAVEKRICQISEACPFFFDAITRVGLTPNFWAFFVGEFRKMKTVGGVHHLIGRVHRNGVTFRLAAGKTLLKFRNSFVRAKKEPFYLMAKDMQKKLMEQGYKRGHAFNLAWNRIMHEFLEGLYLRMRSSCMKCWHGGEKNGGKVD